MRTALVFAVAFSIGCLMAGTLARADGGGGGSSAGTPDRPTCPGGYVYDPITKNCVRQSSGVLPDKTLTDYAFSLAKVGRYAEAIGVLDLVKEPNSPVALNYRGYATRKLGRLEEGIEYYLKSVALDPNYAQVREYLGEAYLIKGDVVQAKAQLKAIKAICGTVCEEYQHLAVAIADPSSI
jgi:tetratricopeptide (TPR) repeat protein